MLFSSCMVNTHIYLGVTSYKGALIWRLFDFGVGYPVICSMPCGTPSRPYTGVMAIDGNCINKYIKRLYGANRAENSAVLPTTVIGLWWDPNGSCHLWVRLLGCRGLRRLLIWSAVPLPLIWRTSFGLSDFRTTQFRAVLWWRISLWVIRLAWWMIPKVYLNLLPYIQIA